MEKIGSGGMGDVWLSQQQQPIQRRVAVKIIKLGMDTREVVARFESERQAMAVMASMSAATLRKIEASTSRFLRPNNLGEPATLVFFSQ